MDPLTQGLLGSCIGQAFYSKKFGRKAFVYGWFAGMFPDIDVVSAHFGWLEKLKHHRGITHSLFFSPVAALLFGYLIWKIYHRRHVKQTGKLQLFKHSNSPPLLNPGQTSALTSWIGLLFLCLFTHPLLDLFTPYGTQLLLPFSSHRFTLNAVGVLDPFYTVILFLAVLFGFVFFKRKPDLTERTAIVALGLSTCYLFYGMLINTQAVSEAQRQLQQNGVKVNAVQSYPTLLQPYLRRIVVKQDNQTLFGYISMWNKKPIIWKTIKIDRHPLIEKLENTHPGQVFKWFTINSTLGNVYKLESQTLGIGNSSIQHRNIVEIDDIRYGYSTQPEFGIWFIRAEFDQFDNLVGEVEFVRRSLPKGISVKSIYRAAFSRT